MTQHNWTLSADLDQICARFPDWERFRGARLFLTGGTGFIGKWLLSALCTADARFDLNLKILVLSRDPQAFAHSHPALAAAPAVEFVAGDITGFAPPDGAFDYIIHAATDASAALNAQAPLTMLDTIVAGTRRLLDFAAQHQPTARILFLSSGAVYGIQDPAISHVDEQCPSAPDCRDPRSTYGEGKRTAEMLCTIYRQHRGLDIVTARIFAVLGPMLSLDIHFAAGNFIRDVLAGKTIEIQGSGEAIRSLLYAGDLTLWLLTMLTRAPSGAVYNVGSEQAISIAALAQRISAVLSGPPVKILGRPDPGWNPGRYVPSTGLIRRELQVEEHVGLDEAIRRTALWNGWTG